MSQIDWQQMSTMPPDYSDRPQRQFIFVVGWKEHSGVTWERKWWDIAYIQRDDQPDCYMGYRRSDMERIMRDGDLDGIEAVTHWARVRGLGPVDGGVGE